MPPTKTPAEEAREVGSALRILRERRRVTQENAAEAMRVSRTAWQNYENGRSVVLRTDVQARLAAAIGATRADLMAVVRELQRGAPGGHSGLEEPAAIYSGPGRRQAIFPTQDGDVIMSLPDPMSEAARTQLRAYLGTFLGGLAV
jgi:transcriptional regulator with XRE-family HTH domain